MLLASLRTIFPPSAEYNALEMPVRYEMFPNSKYGYAFLKLYS